MKITTKKFLGYTLLPRIIPMVRDLFRPGFGLITMSMAQIYAGCGLLPRNHAYLNHQNMGRYGISNVIIEAGRNLKFTRDRLDQVFIYGLLLLAFILLLGQFIICGFVVFTQAAHAGLPIPTNYSGFFITQFPDQDIAYILLDRVFGIPNFFNSCASTGGICLTTDPNAQPEVWPQPYHAALQDMLSFYSVGLCVIAMLIFMYYVVAVLLETAESGTPFGRRFNHVWAPIRLVVAMGLLIPISYGLNGAQILTLYMAKWGSSFATNGWISFTGTLSAANMSNLIDDPAQLTAGPQKLDGGTIFQFYTVASACRKLYAKRAEGIVIDAYLVKNVGAATSQLMENTSWVQAKDFYNNGDIVVVFGEYDATKYPTVKGNVQPYCGEIVLASVDMVDAGAISIQTDYYEQIIKRYWLDAKNGGVLGLPQRTLPAPNGKPEDFFFNAADRAIEYSLGIINAAGTPLAEYADAMPPDDVARNDLITLWTTDLQTYIDAAVQAAIADNWINALDLYGWAGAGIWYNKLAQKNGGLITAIANLPAVRKWPMVMEAVAEEASKTNQDRSSQDRFNPYGYTGSGALTIGSSPGMSMEIARVLNDVYNIWDEATPHESDNAGNSIAPQITQNALTDFLKQLFGTTGLFSMAANTNIHPLAQLVIMGKYLLEASIRNLALGIGMKLLSSVPKGMAEIVGSFLQQIGMMTLAVGFVLYYVVPFMPFLYFFFQVSGWIKGLFEAMVGLPLWALAHIRIDGDGLPGSAAISGYFLILELFLRPILTIFGLIGSIAIFGAQVKVLNEIFNLVTTNVTGYDQAAAANIAAGQAGWYGYYRGYVDQLFYTIIYAIIVYMMGTASFKLIYMIPDKTLRWMGQNVVSFGDEIGQQTPEHLVGKMYGGALGATQAMGGGISHALAGMGGGGSKAAGPK